jgi:hypothetical protein
MPSTITMRVLGHTFPGSANFRPLIAQHRLLFRSVICRHGVPIEVSNRFGLRTCDFYALRAVGIQDIFVGCIGDQTCQPGSRTDQVRQRCPHFPK